MFPCSLAQSGVNNALTNLPRTAPGTLAKSFNTLTPAGDARQRLNRINLSCKIKDLFYLPGSATARAVAALYEAIALEPAAASRREEARCQPSA